MRARKSYPQYANVTDCSISPVVAFGFAVYPQKYAPITGFSVACKTLVWELTGRRVQERLQREKCTVLELAIREDGSARVLHAFTDAEVTALIAGHPVTIHPVVPAKLAPCWSVLASRYAVYKASEPPPKSPAVLLQDDATAEGCMFDAHLARDVLHPAWLDVLCTFSGEIRAFYYHSCASLKLKLARACTWEIIRRCSRDPDSAHAKEQSMLTTPYRVLSSGVRRWREQQKWSTGLLKTCCHDLELQRFAQSTYF